MSVAHLYKITNIKTGEYYVGKHNGYEQNGYWGSGERIRNQLNKYGKENFTYKILCYGTQDYIYELEEKIVTLDLISEDKKCLNLMGGGFGAKFLSDETKKKLSVLKTGLKLSDETKVKLKKARAKQTFTKEQLSKRAESMSKLVWMNDGNRSYRIRPEEVQISKEKGLVEGRFTSYIDDKYKEKFKKMAKNQWQKVKDAGHSGQLIKVN
jgi:hypothetical protein